MTGTVDIMAGSAITIANPVPLPVTGAVALVLGSTVTIDNAAENPVPVRLVNEPTREPVQQSDDDVFSETGTPDLPVLTVPDGKRLVIEYVSTRIQVFGADVVSAYLVTVDTGGNRSDSVPLACHAAAARNLVCSTPIKYYVEPGHRVLMRFLLDAFDNPGGVIEALVSGHYVSLR